MVWKIEFIKNGPSKFDLMLALFDGPGKRQVSFETYNSNRKYIVTVQSVKHQNQERWEIEGVVHLPEVMYSAKYQTSSPRVGEIHIYPQVKSFIRVDYSHSWDDLQKCVDCIWDDFIPDKFPSLERADVVEADMGLIGYDHKEDPTTEEILADLKRRELRPANLQELCAFSFAHPEMQRECPIVALGSVIEGGFSFVAPALCYNKEHDERDLCGYAADMGGEWNERCYFLVLQL